MESEKITFYRTNEDKTEVIEQLPKTVTSQVYDSENEQFLHETITAINAHTKEESDKKHIEVVSSVPNDFAETGILMMVDGSSPDVPSMVTVDGLNENVLSVAEKLEETVRAIHVDAFGAVGDGVTDDTLAFKSAIAMMGTLRKNVLIAEEKHYIISDTLDFTSIDRPVIWLKNSRNSRIEMIADGKPLIKAYNLMIKGVWLHSADSVSTEGSVGIYITKKDSDNRANAAMVKFEDVVIRGFHKGFKSDIEMDGFHADGLTVRDFAFRGIEFDQNNAITTAPTTAPVLRNMFIYSNKDYDAYIYIKGAWLPTFENCILDGQDSFNGSNQGRGLVLHDVTTDHNSRTVGGKISGIHFEDFKTAIEVNLPSVIIENIRIQNCTNGIKRTGGNSVGGLVFTEIHNSYISVRQGGYVLNKSASGGRSFLYAVGCNFIGTIKQKTDTDANGFSELSEFKNCSISDTSYVPENLYGTSIVSRDWLEKIKHHLDTSGGGYLGRKVTNNNGATIMDIDLVDGTDTAKTPSLRFSALGVPQAQLTKNGFEFSRGYKERFTIISANTTIDITENSIFVINATSGNITITLPYVASTLLGRKIIITRMDNSANTVTINRNNNKIDGQSTNATVAATGSITLFTVAAGEIVTL